MERSNYFDDEFVYSNDLNNTEQTKQNQLIKRTQAPLGYSGGIYQGTSNGTGSVFQGGIYGSPADYLVHGNNLFCDSNSYTVDITVATGSALSPNGELIQVTSPLVINLGTAGPTYSWTSSPSVLNYVKIKYQEASGSPGVNDVGTTYFTRYIPSFFITIDGVPPIAASEILLATFTGDATGQIADYPLHDRRLYVRTITSANAVILDPTTKIVGSFITAEDHINAKGTGTPAPTNPHGLTLADIGGVSNVAQHWIEAHASAIIDTTGTYQGVFFNSYQPYITGSPLSPAPHTYISFATPASGAAILAGGAVYPNAISTIYDLIDPAIFSAGDTYYWFYMNSAGSVQLTTTNLDGYAIPDKFVLCSVQRASGGTEYNNFKDLRTFFPTVQENVRADFIENAAFPTLGSGSMLTANMDRIRYQLGRAIDGVGGDWSTIPPLTAGSSSLGDSYHTHSGTPLSSFSIGNGPLPALGVGGSGSAIAFDTLGMPAFLYWNNISNSFFLVRQTVGGALVTNLNVASMSINGDLQFTGSFPYQQVGWQETTDLNTVLRGGPTVSADSLHTHPAIANGIPLFDFISSGSVPSPVSGAWYTIAGSSISPAFVTLQVEILTPDNGYTIEVDAGVAASGSFPYQLVYDTLVTSTYSTTRSFGFMLPTAWRFRVSAAVGTGTIGFINYVIMSN